MVKKDKVAKAKPKCRCASGNPFRTIEERDAIPPELRVSYPWDPDKPGATRTGHQPGCPVDVAAYKVGELYGNWTRMWAQSIIIPTSRGMLEIGKPDFAEGEEPQSDIHSYVGLYRHK